MVITEAMMTLRAFFALRSSDPNPNARLAITLISKFCGKKFKT